MARLIDDEELKKYIEDVRIRLLGHLVGKNLVADAMNEALSLIPKAIDEQPTVDAVEVVHGEWEELPNSFKNGYKCSCCGQTIKVKFWSYCPNCGAKMDGVRRNEQSEKDD